MSELDIQTAIYERLRAVSALTDLLADEADGITDYKNQPAGAEDDTPFPYVTLGDDDHDSWDTDTTLGFESELRVHTWSRYRGRKEAKEIQEQIRKALHYHELVVTGRTTTLLHLVTQTVQPDPDGKTYHGIQLFRYLSDEA